MTNDDISCFLYFSVIPSKKSRCFWLSNSGGLMVDDPPKIAGRYTKTRVQVFYNTVLRNFPLFCPKCKLTHIIDVEKLEIVIKNTEKQTFII